MALPMFYRANARLCIQVGYASVRFRSGFGHDFEIPATWTRNACMLFDRLSETRSAWGKQVKVWAVQQALID
jgi:hypothetical protein